MTRGDHAALDAASLPLTQRCALGLARRGADVLPGVVRTF